MDVFLFAINAILPLILMIVLGYILKRVKVLNDVFLKVGNRFVFLVCIPVLLYQNIYDINSLSSINWAVIAYAVVGILFVFLLGLIVVKLFVPDKKQKGVILQCTFRSNYAIIGVSLATQLAGEQGKAIASIVSAFSIPLFNVLAVISLAMFVGDEVGNVNIKKTLVNIVKNPLIIGCVIGILVLGIRYAIPVDEMGTKVFTIKSNLPFLYTMLKQISQIASPLALIILGGGFTFSAVRGMLKPIILGTMMRVVVVPLLLLGGAVILSKYTNILNFDASVYPALIALFGTPVAVSSAIMSEQMNNDGVLAGQLVIWTSITSVFTIFIAVVILRSMGLL